MRNRHLLWLAVISAAACRKETPDQAVEAGPRLEDSILVVPAANREVSGIGTIVVGPPSRVDTITLNGRIVWNEDVTVRIFSPFGGRVRRVETDIGRRVAAGQTLALLESPDLGQALAEARHAAADLTLATRTLARERDLLAHGVAARREVESAEADSIRAASDKARADARLAVYGADSAWSAQGFPLRSPLGGLVVERNLTPGQEVRPDQAMAGTPQLAAPLFLVTDPTRLWVQLDIPEQDVGRLVPGLPMTLRVLALPGRSWPGRMTLISSEIDPSTRTVKARGVVDNPKGDLKAEMLVAVRIAAPTTGTLSVPAQAVFLEGTDRYVFVQDGVGRFRHRSVTVGAARDGFVPVASGLKPGDRVVVDGMLLLNQLYHSLAPIRAKVS